MALVKCRECEREISSGAKTCPHCGAAKKKKKAGFVKKTFFIAVGLVVVLFIIGSMSDGKSTTGVATQAATPEAAFEFKTTPAELVAAYDANTVAADSKFKSKKYLVEGTVDSINTGIYDSVYITMRGGNPFMQPHFALQDSEKNSAALLSKGQKVALVCIGGGDIAKTPMSRRCTFAR